MNTQPEALRLAKQLDSIYSNGCASQAASELRRLHEVNQMLVDSAVWALDALNSFDLYDGDQLWSSSADAEAIDFVITKLRGALAKAKEHK